MDGINCTVVSATDEEVVCTTGKRPGLIPTDTRFKIDGMGDCALQGNTFLYVNHWSEEDTWGGEFVPTAGDSIWVPEGLNLLYDVDSTEILNAVIVEGSLIFPPRPVGTSVTFDAHYIMVNRGLLEIGTEEFPITNDLTITLWGEKYDPTIPLFGNKVIAVYKGTLDIHGAPVNVTWTDLSQTADVGSN